VSSDLAAVARAQASRMASSGTLSHTPDLSGAVSGWSAVGENVAEAPSPGAAQQALMSSPAHRANILSTAYTQIGIGVAVDRNGTLWVSEIFRKPTTRAAPAPARPAPKTTPKTATVPVPPRHVAPPPTKASRPPATRASTGETASAGSPAQAPGGRASRDLPGGRLPADEAARFATSLAGNGWAGADPVSRILGFVLATSD
jgi:hypothetical protein